MKALALLLLVACGGSKPAAKDPEPAGPTKDTRTPFEKRRDPACKAVGERLVTCAVADAKADLDAGKTTKANYDGETSPEIRHKLADEWGKTCRTFTTSHQLRVLEVCLREEAACEPFADCLQHVNDELKK